MLLPQIEKVIKNLEKMAQQRKGSAFTTGSCVVGNDIEEGIYHARRIISAYDFDNGKPESEQYAELSTLLHKAADEFDGIDAEGYVAGGIKQLAVDIKKII